MNQLLTENASNIQDVLVDKGFNHKVIELSESTRTALDAASTIGCSVGQIVKSLIFKTKLTDKPILILVSGQNRVNEKNIENLVGEQIIKADASFTKKVTGFAIGGIPPVGHKENIDFIFIDEDLLKFESIWAAAGTPNAVFNLQSKDLLQMTKGKVMSF